jgi:hypothetical protein
MPQMAAGNTNRFMQLKMKFDWQFLVQINFTEFYHNQHSQQDLDHYLLCVKDLMILETDFIHRYIQSTWHYWFHLSRNIFVHGCRLVWMWWQHRVMNIIILHTYNRYSDRLPYMLNLIWLLSHHTKRDR